MNLLNSAHFLMASISFYHLDIDGFQLQYQFLEDRIFFQLRYPSQGWIMIGFNDGPEIEHAFLVFGGFPHNQSLVEDHYVLAQGDHQSFFDLGEGSGLKDCQVTRNNNITMLRFSLPKKATSHLAHSFSEGKKIYLWLAHSHSDDFEHHSAKRIGQWIELKQ